MQNPFCQLKNSLYIGTIIMCFRGSFNGEIAASRLVPVLREWEALMPRVTTMIMPAVTIHDLDNILGGLELATLGEQEAGKD